MDQPSKKNKQVSVTRMGRISIMCCTLYHIELFIGSFLNLSVLECLH